MKEIVIIGGVGLLAYWYFQNAKQAPTSVHDVTTAISTGAKSTEQQLIDYAKGSGVTSLQNQAIVAQPQPINLPGQPTLDTRLLPVVAPPTKQSVSQPILQPSQSAIIQAAVASNYIQPAGSPVQTILEPRIVTAVVKTTVLSPTVTSRSIAGFAGNFRD